MLYSIRLVKARLQKQSEILMVFMRYGGYSYCVGLEKDRKESATKQVSRCIQTVSKKLTNKQNVSSVTKWRSYTKSNLRNLNKNNNKKKLENGKFFCFF